MANLIQQKQIEPLFDFYRSTDLPYINNSTLAFTHGWVGFNPITDWYQVSAWGVCLQTQQGWQPGDRILLNGRRGTIFVDSTNIYFRIGDNGVISGRKESGNEFSLIPNRWQIYIMGQRLRT